MAEIIGGTTGITITTQDDPGVINTGEIVPSLPIVGGGVALYNSAAGALSDGQLDGGEITGLAMEGSSFISSCTDAVSSAAADPIGWLISQGLGFLISVFEPLQDLIHLVSGDGPALSTAAENFNNIGAGLTKFGEQFDEDARAVLSRWEGAAADSAAEKLGAFGNGISGITAQAGNIAQLLQISSMVMTVIEEFIKALLTELISWAIMIWIPALAAAFWTAGASTAAAGAATATRATSTVSRATSQVSWLRRILDAIKELLAKLTNFFKQVGQNFRKNLDATKAASQAATKAADAARESGDKISAMTKLYSESGELGKRALKGFENGGDGSLSTGFRNAMRETAVDNLKEQAGLGGVTFQNGSATVENPAQTAVDIIEKATSYGDDIGTANEYGDTGTEREKWQISGDLRL
jgi:hypothetical protein